MAEHKSSKTRRLTVLISGSGTNLQAIIDACNTEALPNTTIVRVISDKKSAYGLERAKNAGIATHYHGVVPYKKQYPSDEADPQQQQWRRAFDADLAKLVLEDSPDLIVCAGYMKILTPSFLEPIAAAKIGIINLHPALPGDLVGAGCIDRAWEEFKQGKRTKTGIMVHYVILEVDMGKPIDHEVVSIEGCESQEQLEDRIHRAEHILIVRCTKKALDNRP